MQEYIKFKVFIIGQKIFLHLLRYHPVQMLFEYEGKKEKVCIYLSQRISNSSLIIKFGRSS